MTQIPGLKAALKRGALLAAANWQLVIIQFVAESSLKLLLAVPIVGGAFLVALLLDTSLTELLRGDVREIVAAIVSALTASPAALAAFVASSLLVLLGGSARDVRRQGGHGGAARRSRADGGPDRKAPAPSSGVAPRVGRCDRAVPRRTARGSGVATSGSVSGCLLVYASHRRCLSRVRVPRLRAGRQLGDSAGLDRGRRAGVERA